MKRLTALLLAGLLLLAPLLAQALPLQDCHRVTMTKKDKTNKNRSVLRVWVADTCLDSVDEELAAITADMAARLGADLPEARNRTSKNSRLDVEIRYSRTGLTWMSFLVQARKTYHHTLTGQEIVSLTYDMTTGEKITLEDIFPAGSEAWALLTEGVRAACEAYFPSEEPDRAELEGICTPEGIRSLDFTLHGLSLVIHIPAQRLYPDHLSLIEVPFMYPDIRGYMTEKAQEETDNLAYYKTCALTFDDGPVSTNTTLTLQSLMETGSLATFFVVGNRIASNQDLVQREHDEGHAVGTHNWTHADVTNMNAARIREMKPKCTEAMIAAIGIPERYDRVPYGLYPKMIKAQAGWAYIQWSLDTYDWRGRSTASVLAKVKKEIADGDIILCHDIKDKTPASAKAVSAWLQEAGYMLLTIDELFAKDGVVLDPDRVYFRCTDGVTEKK